MRKTFRKSILCIGKKAIPAELGVIIGAIAEFQRLINHDLQSEKKEVQIYMCGALEELVNEGVQRNRQEGRMCGAESVKGSALVFGGRKSGRKGCRA